MDPQLPTSLPAQPASTAALCSWWGLGTGTGAAGPSECPCGREWPRKHMRCCARMAGRSRGGLLFCPHSNQEPGFHVARGPANAWPTQSWAPMDPMPATNMPACPSTPALAQHWACVCGRRGHVVPSRRGDQSVASPLLAASQRTPAVPFLPVGWRPLWVCLSPDPGDTSVLPALSRPGHPSRLSSMPPLWWWLPNTRLHCSLPQTPGLSWVFRWGGGLFPVTHRWP